MNMNQLTQCNIPVVLYGAGRDGRFLANYLVRNDICNIYGFCDSNKDKWGKVIEGVKVFSIDNLTTDLEKFIVIICIQNKIEQEKILGLLKNIENIEIIYTFDEFLNSKENNRNLCADFHLQNMDIYFEEAEKSANIDSFWHKNSIFYQLFEKLDLDRVVELACGRGRHVPQYINKAKSIILVDILDKNIDICKKRFNDSDKISFYKNDGDNLKFIEDSSCTSLFTYDAMVHFESIDIYNYLVDIHRILKDGGRALFHHSNLDTDYRLSFISNEFNGRSYMSMSLFAHFAYRAGFKILEQHKISWNGVPGMDGITLVEKNN